MKETEKLTSKISEIIQRNKFNILDDLYGKIAFAFLFCEEMMVVHDQDPPWDCSGTLIKTGRHYSFGGFVGVSDFLSRAYTGAVLSSGVPGMRFTHEVYMDQFDCWVMDSIKDCIEAAVPLKSVDSKTILDLISKGAIDKADISDWSEEIAEWALAMPLQWAVFKGKTKACEELQKRIDRVGGFHKEICELMENATRAWTKVSAAYQLKFGQPLPEVIDAQECMRMLSIMLDENIDDRVIRSIAFQYENRLTSQAARFLEDYKTAN